VDYAWWWANNAVMSDAGADQDRVARLVDRATIKLMYEPVALIASVLGGMVASALFGRIWRSLPGREDAPQAMDQETSWAAIVPAAALHGVIFGVVKALVDRASANGFRRLTGRWPGRPVQVETGDV
jgi:hypothetical protein